MKQFFLSVLFAVFFLYVPIKNVYAFNCSSAVTGNFNLAGTWTNCNSTTPQTTDSITINNGHTVTLVASTTVAGITINSGGILAANTRKLTNTDWYTNNGAHTGTTSRMTLSGPSGTIIDGTGSYSPTGIVTISTADKTVAAGSNLSFDKITISGITLTNNSTAGLTVVTALAGTGQLTQGSGSILNIGRTSTITTLDASVATNEVHYTSTTANQTIKTANYYHLYIDKSGRIGTTSGTTNVLGNLVVTAGTIRFAGSTFTVTGTTDIYGTLTDNSGGVSGGNNIFTGLVTMHSGSIWLGIVGEVCDFHFKGGFVMNGASFTSATGIYYFETNNQSITGSTSFTIDNLSVTGIQLTNSSTGTLTIRTALTGTGEFIQGTNSALNISGTSTITSFTASASGNTVNYNGTASQTVHAGEYQTLLVDSNTNGAVNITADTTVNTILTLGATKLTTTSGRMILGNSATISRSNGYVVGTVGKQFNSSSSFTYPIGDTSNYTPIDLTLAGVSGTGSIDGSVTNTDHTDIANSTIDSSRSVNRNWSLVNNSLSFSSYTPVFNFVGGDVDAGATTSDMTLAKDSLGLWSILSSTCGATSCTASNLISMSDFQIGVAIPSPTTTPTPTPTSVGASSESSPSSSSSTPGPSATPPPAGGLAQPEPTGVPSGPSALFDIISSPLLLARGSATMLPTLAFISLLGFSLGILIIIFKRRRNKKNVEYVSQLREL